jgi:hypothetical protein
VSNVFITTDGDTMWLSCYATDPDSEFGHPIRPVEPGDTWEDLLVAVHGHHCPDESEPTDDQ